MLCQALPGQSLELQSAKNRINTGSPPERCQKYSIKNFFNYVESFKFFKAFRKKL